MDRPKPITIKGLSHQKRPRPTMPLVVSGERPRYRSRSIDLFSHTSTMSTESLAATVDVNILVIKSAPRSSHKLLMITQSKTKVRSRYTFMIVDGLTERVCSACDKNSNRSPLINTSTAAATCEAGTVRLSTAQHSRTTSCKMAYTPMSP